MDIWDKIRRHKVGGIAIVFVITQIICVIVSLIFLENFRYISHENIQMMLKAIPQLGILAMGVGILMISGEFDLSVGSNFVLSAYLMALIFYPHHPIPYPFPSFYHHLMHRSRSDCFYHHPRWQISYGVLKDRSSLIWPTRRLKCFVKATIGPFKRLFGCCSFFKTAILSNS